MTTIPTPEDLVRTLVAAVLASLPPTAAPGGATVDPNYGGGPVRIVWDGETQLSGRSYPVLFPGLWTFSPGEHVLVLPYAHGAVIVGPMGDPS